MQPILHEDTLLDLAYRLKALRVSNAKEFKYRWSEEGDRHKDFIEKDLNYIEAKINQLKDEFKQWESQQE
jgi:hypothetical protein